jgi:hypothetical protein
LTKVARFLTRKNRDAFGNPLNALVEQSRYAAENPIH